MAGMVDKLKVAEPSAGDANRGPPRVILVRISKAVGPPAGMRAGTLSHPTSAYYESFEARFTRMPTSCRDSRSNVANIWSEPTLPLPTLLQSGLAVSVYCLVVPYLKRSCVSHIRSTAKPPKDRSQ